MASGPSLTQEDIDYCRGRAFVIVINTTWRKAPWADVLYAADATWWHHEAPGFEGRRISCDDSCRMYGVEIWEQDRNQGLSFAPRTLKTGHARDLNGRIQAGGNSGYQAVNLAAQLGFKRIILLGYDMKAGPNGEIHHHGAHPRPLNNPEASHFPNWVATYETMLPDLKEHQIDVFNCSRDTALSCFPRVSLRHVL